MSEKQTITVSKTLEVGSTSRNRSKLAYAVDGGSLRFGVQHYIDTREVTGETNDKGQAIVNRDSSYMGATDAGAVGFTDDGQAEVIHRGSALDVAQQAIGFNRVANVVAKQAGKVKAGLDLARELGHDVPAIDARTEIGLALSNCSTYRVARVKAVG